MKIEHIIIYAIIFIIVLILIFIFLTSDNSNIGRDKIEQYCEDDPCGKILYSYGLFSCKPMTKRMKQNIQHNKEVTKLPYHVVGPKEVEQELAKMEKIVPGITKAYNKIPRGVAKSDLARMVSLYMKGGHYADLDVTFKTKPIIKLSAVVLYTECYSYKDKHIVRIANYALSAPKGHPFILAVIVEIVNRINNMKKKCWSDKDIILTTGPDVITCVYHEQVKQWKNKSCFVLLIDYWKSKNILTHHCAGTWRRNKDNCETKCEIKDDKCKKICGQKCKKKCIDEYESELEDEQHSSSSEKYVKEEYDHDYDDYDYEKEEYHRREYSNDEHSYEDHDKKEYSHEKCDKRDEHSYEEQHHQDHSYEEHNRRDEHSYEEQHHQDHSYEEKYHQHHSYEEEHSYQEEHHQEQHHQEHSYEEEQHEREYSDEEKYHHHYDQNDSYEKY